MKNTLGDKSGMIYTFVVILVALFAVMVCYIALDQAVKVHIVDMGKENFNVSNSTMDNLVMVWDAFPFIFALSLFVMGLLAAMASSRYG
ncbi:MAG: hypothetical protein B6U72_03050 [Candidatus Altiarchaeales archaeon ex4484_2]|nr:MAG: hypothetical protein B6U72_03050 [Candidatus Altiarchaeales archaeon ex4484_2]